MRFCPKCNGIMIPVKNGERYYLICIRCGYRVEAEDDIICRYRLKGEIKKHVITSKPSSGEEPSPDLDLLELIREETREIRDRILVKVIS